MSAFPCLRAVVDRVDFIFLFGFWGRICAADDATQIYGCTAVVLFVSCCTRCELVFNECTGVLLETRLISAPFWLCVVCVVLGVSSREGVLERRATVASGLRCTTTSQ